MSTTRSQLYRFARDLGNVEAVEHGYKRGGLSEAAGGAAQREARRVIYREGNRQINHFVRALALTALPLAIGGGGSVAGGMACPTMGAEALLRLPPFQWMGKLSYSLYLWHWPILIIAAQHFGHPLSVEDNLLWVLFALGLSVGSYFLVENPIRHWNFLARSGGRSVSLGGLLIALSLAVATFEIASHP